MADDKTQGATTTAPEGSTISVDKEPIPAHAPAPDNSYQILKAKHDQAQAELRKTQKQLSERDASESDRLSLLEVENARSKAALKFGLTLDDAEVLKGTPTEIMAQAEYWHGRLEAKGATDVKPTEPTVKEVIDKKVDASPAQVIPPPPTPVASTLTWMETYKMATVPERYKMDEDVKAGRVDPTADYKE